MKKKYTVRDKEGRLLKTNKLGVTLGRLQDEGFTHTLDFYKEKLDGSESRVTSYLRDSLEEGKNSMVILYYGTEENGISKAWIIDEDTGEIQEGEVR